MATKPNSKPKSKQPGLANDDVGEQNRLDLWRSMLEVRQVEKRAQDLFLQNLIKGTTHLSIGQEAIAAGFGVSMKEGDYARLEWNHEYDGSMPSRPLRLVAKITKAEALKLLKKAIKSGDK